MKKIVVRLSDIMVTSLETDAFMAIVAHVDKLMVRSNLSARSRKEGTEGAVAILKGKENVQSQDSDVMSYTLRKVEEVGLNAEAGHT